MTIALVGLAGLPLAFLSCLWVKGLHNSTYWAFVFSSIPVLAVFAILSTMVAIVTAFLAQKPAIKSVHRFTLFAASFSFACTAGLLLGTR